MPKRIIAGFPTYWTTFGQGPRNALMIHCSLAHSGAWGGLARKLSGALTMIAFDVPGHGRSDKWDGSHGEIQGASTDIAAGLLNKPADIIGHSFGATIALRLAVEHPDLVRSLTLIEPVFFAVAWADNPSLAQQHNAVQKGFVDAWIAGDRETAAREFIAVWGDGTPWNQIPVEQRKLLANDIHLIPAGASAIYDDVAGILSSGALERIEVPSLLIEGSDSPHYIAAINDGLEQRIPDTTRTVIVGAGHMVAITHADQVATEVLQLLKRS